MFHLVSVELMLVDVKTMFAGGKGNSEIICIMRLIIMLLLGLSDE
jgi:hypothetical protein